MGSPEAGGDLGILNRNGEVAYLISGWSVDDPENPIVVKFGILQADTRKLGERGQNAALAQFAGIVVPGLILARHVFRGLRRPLYADQNPEADRGKLVHTWRPACDFEWPNRFDDPRRMPAPDNCVFVVLVSKNERHLERWPEVYGWIDRWNWVFEDHRLPGAPIDWDSRYEERLFTREGA